MKKIRELFHNRLKKLFLLIDSFLLPLLLPSLMRLKGVKMVHFSIDDVKYDISSDGILITDKLYSFMEKLGGGIFLTLFLFERDSNCTYNLPPFVKIGVHKPSLIDGTLKKYINSNYFRFHRYEAMPDDIRKMRRGIALCSHDGRRSYDLTCDEQKEVTNHYCIRKGLIEYVATDIRLEWPITFQLMKMKKCECGKCVVFGHEWGINIYESRLMTFISYCKKVGIQFIN